MTVKVVETKRLHVRHMTRDEPKERVVEDGFYWSTVDLAPVQVQDGWITFMSYHFRVRVENMKGDLVRLDVPDEDRAFGGPP